MSALSLQAERSATHLVVRPLVTLNTNGLDRQQGNESLRDLIVQTSSSNFLNVDLVGVLQDLNLFTRDFAKDSNSETGTREGVSADQVSRNVEKSTESSDLV